MRRAAAGLILLLAGCSGKSSEVKEASTPPVPVHGTFAVLETERGEITIHLEAPSKASERFAVLARDRKLYDKTAFFRVIPEFMVQGGAPAARLEALAGADAGSANPFDRPGILAFAGPPFDGGQFFITLSPAPWLHHKHPVVGEVVEGLEAAAALSRVPRRADEPERPMRAPLLRRVRIEER